MLIPPCADYLPFQEVLSWKGAGAEIFPPRRICSASKHSDAHLTAARPPSVMSLRSPHTHTQLFLPAEARLSCVLSSWEVAAIECRTARPRSVTPAGLTEALNRGVAARPLGLRTFPFRTTRRRSRHLRTHSCVTHSASSLSLSLLSQPFHQKLGHSFVRIKTHCRAPPLPRTSTTLLLRRGLCTSTPVER